RTGLTHEGGVQERLRGFAHTYLRCFLEEFPALAVGLRELPTFPAPLFAEIVNAHNHTIIAILRQILRDGLAQGELRPHDIDNCMRAIVGIVHQFIREKGLDNGDAIRAGTEQVAEYYARGLLAEPGAACNRNG
ncbi:MAG TPA: hypothetical protein VFA70_13525, partial [Dehalococcoidia bacterium]|nr:hypothetical protein [Dehalococcoidia bacterium]